MIWCHCGWMKCGSAGLGGHSTAQFSLLVGGLEHDFYDFPLGIIIPTDELIFFRGIETTNQSYRGQSTLFTRAIASDSCFNLQDLIDQLFAARTEKHKTVPTQNLWRVRQDIVFHRNITMSYLIAETLKCQKQLTTGIVAQTSAFVPWMTRKTIASPKGNALVSVNNLNFGRTCSTPCMSFPPDDFFARLQTSPLTGTYLYRTSIVP